MMLRLESASSKNECRFCHTVTDITSMIQAGDLSTVATVQLSQRKEWMTENQTENNERPTVEQDCPKCNNNLTFYTAR